MAGALPYSLTPLCPGAAPAVLPRTPVLPPSTAVPTRAIICSPCAFSPSPLILPQHPPCQPIFAFPRALAFFGSDRPAESSPPWLVLLGQKSRILRTRCDDDDVLLFPASLYPCSLHSVRTPLAAVECNKLRSATELPAYRFCIPAPVTGPTASSTPFSTLPFPPRRIGSLYQSHGSYPAPIPSPIGRPHANQNCCSPLSHHDATFVLVSAQLPILLSTSHPRHGGGFCRCTALFSRHSPLDSTYVHIKLPAYVQAVFWPVSLAGDSD
jgi:hypothetical protein